LASSQFVDFPVSGYCCTEFKKNPSKRTKLNPIIATRIEESNNRKSAWKKSGCNSYSRDYKHGVSRPLSLWKDEDVDLYVKDENVALSALYTQYEQKRTGCKICPYGAQLDGSRFDLLKDLEPKAYDYFINRTKLGYILMITDVDIISDDDYMKRKRIVDQEVKAWHKLNKGDDQYLEYKCRLALSKVSYEELIGAIDHIVETTSAKWRYDPNEIKKKLNELNTK
jgi:3'-phosphoadenosine 5'-phosphosulfate sulfotransferase (PAPS reductase)/FAD synthetase